MRCRPLLIASALALALPTQAVSQPAAGAVAESVQPGSSVSVGVEPALDDGRLVLKLAVKNLGKAPVQLGPASVTMSKPGGEPIALYPLRDLVNDVRVAAGMQVEEVPGGALTAGAYAAPQMATNEAGPHPKLSRCFARHPVDQIPCFKPTGSCGESATKANPREKAVAK